MDERPNDHDHSGQVPDLPDWTPTQASQHTNRGWED